MVLSAHALMAHSALHVIRQQNPNNDSIQGAGTHVMGGIRNVARMWCWGPQLVEWEEGCPHRGEIRVSRVDGVGEEGHRRGCQQVLPQLRQALQVALDGGPAGVALLAAHRVHRLCESRVGLGLECAFVSARLRTHPRQSQAVHMF